MQWLYRQSIARRTLLAIVVGVSSAVLVSAIVFFFWNRYALQRFVVDNMAATAEVVADGLQAAVAFDDREAADDTLASLASKPEVDLACAYNRQGWLLAEYRARPSSQCPSSPRPEGTYGENGGLVLSRPVRQEGRPIGSLYLRRSLNDIAAQSTQQLLVLALISAISLVVGLLLSNRLQRAISDPIVRLANTAHGVSEQHDYSLRATKETGGEIGTLVDTFNRMLEQIESRTRQLQDAVQARDDFLSVAAHELRNPVNAVQLQLVGVLRAVQRGAHPLTEEWISERIGQANVQVNRLIRLLDNLLDASRIADHGIELEVEDVEFASIVRTVIERFEEDPKNRHVVADLTAVVGRWDRLRLEQIVTNLLSNALKYGNGKPIVIALTAESEMACLSVTDHGIGIDPDRQERLFTRFERAVSKQRYGGFGLGLWITRSIVDAMGGQIAVDSRPGQGSTFRVELPRTSPSATAQPPTDTVADHSHVLKTVV